jgi:hypothetical protein
MKTFALLAFIVLIISLPLSIVSNISYYRAIYLLLDHKKIKFFNQFIIFAPRYFFRKLREVIDEIENPRKKQRAIRIYKINRFLFILELLPLGFAVFMFVYAVVITLMANL